MYQLHLICVGKQKDPHLEALEKEYLKRLKNLKLSLHELRSHEENKEAEALEIEKKCQSIAPITPILLCENGRSFSSPHFSKWLYEQLEYSHRLAFIIGGAAGLSEKLNQKYSLTLSLGELTYPHRFARLLLTEQIYRAECIKQGHPYHK